MYIHVYIFMYIYMFIYVYSYMLLIPPKVLLSRKSPHQETQIPRNLAVQIHMEILVYLEFVAFNLSFSIYIYTYVYIYIYTCVYIHIPIYKHTYVHIRICMRLTYFTENAAFPKSTTSQNSNSLVSRGTNSN